MPRRPPAGFHARRAAARKAKPQITWDDDPTPETTAAAAPQSHPVGQITAYIHEQLRSDSLVSDIWIEGEVRSFSRSGRGHMYFDLADDEGALACVFFAGRNFGVRLEQGDQVLVHGQAGLYLPRGALQINVDAVQPIGAGVLQAEFERLYRNLEAEGLFAAARKRSLPRYPRRIGVVTSSSGAVWHDIQQVLARRWPLAALTLSPCLTQGDGAAASIAQAIDALNLLTDADEPDVIIVARGGGSPEDLWAYNEEPVARAIFASAIPVVSAVGHETDVSIADHVADLRAPTPSAAAELVAPDRAEEAARVRGLRAAFDQLADARLEQHRRANELSLSRLERAAPDASDMRVPLQRRRRELDRAIELVLSRRVASLSAADARLAALNPAATLARGYAIVTAQDDRVVTSVLDVSPGDAFTVQLEDGRIRAKATEISAHTREQNS